MCISESFTGDWENLNQAHAAVGCIPEIACVPKIAFVLYAASS